MENNLLIDVLNKLQTHLGKIEIFEMDDECLVIQMSDNEESQMTITIKDAEIPEYIITYQAIPSDAMSIKEFENRTSPVVFEGILWVAKSLKKYGFVLPEYPHHQIRKSVRRKKLIKSV